MFEVRCNDHELLDGPEHVPEFIATAYRWMTRINRLSGSVGGVRRFIEAEYRARRHDGPLRVLDIGSGACALALSVVRWATGRGLDVRFTCIDPNPVAQQVGSEKARRAPKGSICFVNCDLAHFEPDIMHDCAVASMFFHHLDDEAIVPAVDRLRDLVTNSLLIDDLLRHWTTHALAAALLSPAPADVRHDGKTSVRRGFQPRELSALLSQSRAASFTVRSTLRRRVVAVVRFRRPRQSDASGP